MKIALPAFAFIAMQVATGARAESQGATPAPQPRVRLNPALSHLSAADVPTGGLPAAIPAIVMEKVTVSASKPANDSLAAAARQRQPEEPRTFSILSGGGLTKSGIAGLSIEIGLWQHQDVLAADSVFKGPKTRGEFDVVRIKW